MMRRLLSKFVSIQTMQCSQSSITPPIIIPKLAQTTKFIQVLKSFRATTKSTFLFSSFFYFSKRSTSNLPHFLKQTSPIFKSLRRVVIILCSPKIFFSEQQLFHLFDLVLFVVFLQMLRYFRDPTSIHFEMSLILKIYAEIRFDMDHII